MLDTVAQAVIAVDLEGRITYRNRFAEGLYGWSAEEVMGCPANEVIAPEDQRALAGEIWVELMAGKSWSGQFVVRGRDGAAFPVAVTDAPVHDGRGNLVGMIGISTDITERKKAEAKLRRSEANLAEAQRLAVVEAVAEAYGYALVSAYLLEG